MQPTTRLILLFLVMLTCAFPTASFAQVDPNLRNRLQQTPIVVNHSSLPLFNQIPAVYLERARNIRFFFTDRSVGQNTTEALDCFANANSWASTLASCRRDYTGQNAAGTWEWKTFNATDLQNGIVPNRILFSPSTTIYNRSNWTFLFDEATQWHTITTAFLGTYQNTHPDYDVYYFQFNYLMFGDNSINQPSSDSCTPSQPHCYGGFFVPRPAVANRYDISDLEEFDDRKIFIYTTGSLAKPTGNEHATTFNEAMRSYARNNNKILFDFADIESHTDTGAPCYDNRDGVEFCVVAGSNTNCEGNHPNDGINAQAICKDYTTEVEGGHLGSVSAGKIAVAKGLWLTMAQIAGWQPGSTVTPPPTTNTPVPPTPTPLPGDFDRDGNRDFPDFRLLLTVFNQSNPQYNLVGPSLINIFDVNYFIRLW